MEVLRKIVIGGRPLLPSVFKVHLGLSITGSAAVNLGPESLSPGPADRELLHVLLTQARGQLAECYLSVAGQSDYLILMGPISKVNTKDGQYEVQVRELSAVLEAPCVFHLRNKTARDIVAAVEQKSGLHFIVPARAPYFNERKPIFQSSGTLRTALEKVIVQWELAEVLWYQLPDGTIFFGPWREGPFTNSDVPIEPKLVLEKSIEQRTIRLPLIPALRPGMVVDCGFRFRIDELFFEGDTTLLKYTRL